jgi:CheY-like chemotaxis protein
MANKRRNEIPVLSRMILSDRPESRERRRCARVDASGAAIVHGMSELHGWIVDLAVGGLRLVVDQIVSAREVGARVGVVVRLDGVDNWFRMTGSVVRIEARGSTTALGIELFVIPQDFEDLVQDELVSALERAREPEIVVVDVACARRDLVAAAFRAMRCHVTEVSSPLEAIAVIDRSRRQLWAVVVGDTELASRADDFRRFLHDAFPRVPLIGVGEGRRTRTHLTVDRFPDLALQIHNLVAMRDRFGAPV